MTYDLGSAKHVFINWDLIEPGYGVAWKAARPTSWEMPYGVDISVHPARIETEPLVWPEHEWESMINSYCTLFEDDGRFRLYYECHYVAPRDEPSDLKAMLAYAESTDGVHWHKPTIGTVSFKGSTANNLVYGLDLAQGRGAHGATVFKDPNGSAEERYKLVFMGRENGVLCVFGAVSPDGLHWQSLAKPLLTDYMSDTQTVIRFDEAKGRYVGYFRGWKGLKLGQWHGRRTIAYAESDRFDTWPRPETIVAPDVADGPATDIYTNAYSPWPGAAQAHLMFPAYYRRDLDIPELHLLTSTDGQHWERLSRQPLIQIEALGAFWTGGVYAGCGLVPLQSGEWSLPVGPKWHSHNEGHFPEGRPASPPHRGFLCRAVWREDGLTSLEAETEGQVTTVPVTFDGSRLEVNAACRFAGELRVELGGVNGDTMPGHSFADCDPLEGSAVKQVVTWQGNSDLSQWRGQPVRLRFRLRRARLHALAFA